MIRLNDTEWPLVELWVGPDNLDVAAAQLPAFCRIRGDEARGIVAIVQGHGEAAITRLHTLAAWMRDFEPILLTHARGITFVIENHGLRTMTAALLRLQGNVAFGCPVRVMSSLPPACAWLSAQLDVPVYAEARGFPPA